MKDGAKHDQMKSKWTKYINGRPNQKSNDKYLQTTIVTLFLGPQEAVSQKHSQCCNIGVGVESECYKIITRSTQLQLFDQFQPSQSSTQKETIVNTNPNTKLQTIPMWPQKPLLNHRKSHLDKMHDQHQTRLVHEKDIQKNKSKSGAHSNDLTIGHNQSKLQWRVTAHSLLQRNQVFNVSHFGVGELSLKDIGCYTQHIATTHQGGWTWERENSNGGEGFSLVIWSGLDRFHNSDKWLQIGRVATNERFKREWA